MLLWHCISCYDSKLSEPGYSYSCLPFQNSRSHWLAKPLWPPALDFKAHSQTDKMQGRIFNTTLKSAAFGLLQFSQQQVNHFHFLDILSSNPLFIFCGFTLQRWLHSRNKKAMELIAKGWSALKEVDRVIDYCELNDRRLIPLLKACYTYIL